MKSRTISAFSSFTTFLGRPERSSSSKASGFSTSKCHKNLTQHDREIDNQTLIFRQMAPLESGQFETYWNFWIPTCLNNIQISNAKFRFNKINLLDLKIIISNIKEKPDFNKMSVKMILDHFSTVAESILNIINNSHQFKKYQTQKNAKSLGQFIL